MNQNEQYYLTGWDSDDNAPVKTDLSHLSLSELFGYRQCAMDLGCEDKIKAANDEIDARYNESLQDSLESESH
jgi:hypothetical protein